MTVEIGSQIPIGKFNAYTLQNPYRLVIDIPGAKSVLGRPSIPVNNDIVRQIRIGTNPQNLRVVFDIASAQLPQYQIAKQDNSLLVHLQAGSAGPAAGTPQGVDPKDSAAVPDQQVASSDTTEAAPDVSPDEDLDIAPQHFNGPNISFDFKDADIKNVLRLIADISGKNMIIGETVTGRVTLKLDNIPLDEAMVLILDTHGAWQYCHK